MLETLQFYNSYKYNSKNLDVENNAEGEIISTNYKKWRLNL